jgi:neutral ceramidase
MLHVNCTSVDLSPSVPVPMGGHEGPDRLTVHTHGRLEANMLALGDGEDTIVLISVDTLFVGPTLTERILRACKDRFNIGPERVLVLASHTHSAPMLDVNKSKLGRTEPTELSRWGSAIEDAIRSAPMTGASALRVGIGECDLAVNRRTRWRAPTLLRLMGKQRSSIYMCDNDRGPRDRRLRTAVWFSGEGQPVAAFWSFACHPTAFPVKETASADYIGVVRQALREQLGASIPVIFAPGCMGDVRPRSPRSWKTLKRLPQLLIYGPQPVAHTVGEWENWASQVAKATLTIDREGVKRAIDGKPSARPMVRRSIDYIFDGASPTLEFQVKGVLIPGLGRIIAMNCEPVAKIPAILGAEPDDLVIGYEGDVFGYLPTDRMIKEGGYESDRFKTYFGLKGRFRTDLDLRIRTIGRQLLDSEGA